MHTPKEVLLALKNKPWREIISHAIHARSTPHHIALGVALGLGISVPLTFGAGMFVALFVAWRMGANLIATYLGTLIVNPFSGPFFYAASYWLGAQLLGLAVEMPTEFSFAALANIAYPLYLGGIILALALGLLLYGIAYGLAQVYRKKRPYRP